jgi:hypothetical protein
MLQMKGAGRGKTQLVQEPGPSTVSPLPAPSDFWDNLFGMISFDFFNFQFQHFCAYFNIHKEFLRFHVSRN